MGLNECFIVVAQIRASACFPMEARDPEKGETSTLSGREYVKAVYRHPTYLTYMQSTS